VSDIEGSAAFAKEKIRLVMESRRKELMTMSLTVASNGALSDVRRYAFSHLSVAKRVKIQVALRTENKAKLIEQ
jgi:hypothetical protein